eukprot:PhM_4_TR8140/c0_g1_i1/m.53690/K20862/yigB; FMN hydrolase / 5-amino-6-(5-phospho-D-ribitylamino)uracil phosphatase
MTTPPNNRQKKKPILTIDLDDTLWDVVATTTRAEHHVADYMSIKYPHLSDAAQKIRPGTPHSDAHKSYCRSTFSSLLHACQFSEYRKEFIRAAIIKDGDDDDDHSLVEELYDEYYKMRNTVSWFPGAVEFLHAAQDYFRIIAITNGNSNLGKIGVDHLFFEVLSPGRGFNPKPDQHMFEHVMRRITDEQKEDGNENVVGFVVHVGDNPALDVAAARRANMKTVWVNCLGLEWPENVEETETEKLVRADAEVTCLTELLEEVLHLYG